MPCKHPKRDWHRHYDIQEAAEKTDCQLSKTIMCSAPRLFSGIQQARGKVGLKVVRG